MLSWGVLHRELDLLLGANRLRGSLESLSIRVGMPGQSAAPSASTARASPLLTLTPLTRGAASSSSLLGKADWRGAGGGAPPRRALHSNTDRAMRRTIRDRVRQARDNVNA